MTKQRLLQLAHKGLLIELEEIQNELQADAPSGQPAKPTSGKPKGKRVLSPEARERIAQAQRRRWKKTNDSANNPVEA